MDIRLTNANQLIQMYYSACSCASALVLLFSPAVNTFFKVLMQTYCVFYRNAVQVNLRGDFTAVFK